jgi:TatA/E family protein of Tat protein translocase
MLGNVGTAELLIISVVVLVFFGSKKLNEAARSLGKSTKEYKKLKKEYSKAVSGNYKDTEEEKSDKKDKGGDQ